MLLLAFTALVFLLFPGPRKALAQTDRYTAQDAELEALISRLRTRAYDSIPAIDRPEFVSAVQAAEFLRPGDMVIGVYKRGVAKAYPVQFLNGREVVNDSLGSGPITVTW